MNNKSGLGFGVLVALCVIALVVTIVGLSAFTPVKYGSVKVVKRFGRLTAVYQPGLHWKVPLIDGTETMVTAIRSYETSDNPKESQADYTDYPVSAQTIDGQQVSVKYTVKFSIPADGAVQVLETLGPMNAVVENLIKANSRNASRTHAQYYTAEDLYGGSGIAEYQAEVEGVLNEVFTSNGVHLDSFLVRKIDFDPDYVLTIEQQQIAQEQIETAKYQSEAAEYEKQKLIRQAEAEAERNKLNAEAEAFRNVELAKADAQKVELNAQAQANAKRLAADADAYAIVVEAKANAEEQRLIGEAQGDAIAFRGQALALYPEVIQMEFAENFAEIDWGVLPADSILSYLPLQAPTLGE
jgi:regulator of protease activity HflC (stomatin/prohibitin superfamily)